MTHLDGQNSTTYTLSNSECFKSQNSNLQCQIKNVQLSSFKVCNVKLKMFKHEIPYHQQLTCAKLDVVGGIPEQMQPAKPSTS